MHVSRMLQLYIWDQSGPPPRPPFPTPTPVQNCALPWRAGPLNIWFSMPCRLACWNLGRSTQKETGLTSCLRQHKENMACICGDISGYFDFFYLICWCRLFQACAAKQVKNPIWECYVGEKKHLLFTRTSRARSGKGKSPPQALRTLRRTM